MIHGHRTDLSASSSRGIRSLGAIVSLQQSCRRKRRSASGEIFHMLLSCAASVDVVDEKDIDFF
ncbi:uncharacterized protein G2W53_015123 [Senna tora]|uniref:Uncharacterized protein n=1 Tax=Senna tora TaxID=362788 RepID=A0A834WUF7_9FABA|nr:uncharacterized protein G2W53_015123 [Senna tora]